MRAGLCHVLSPRPKRALFTHTHYLQFGVSSDEALTSVNPGLNIWTIPEGTVVK